MAGQAHRNNLLSSLFYFSSAIAFFTLCTPSYEMTVLNLQITKQLQKF